MKNLIIHKLTEKNSMTIDKGKEHGKLVLVINRDAYLKQLLFTVYFMNQNTNK